MESGSKGSRRLYRKNFYTIAFDTLTREVAIQINVGRFENMSGQRLEPPSSITDFVRSPIQEDTIQLLITLVDNYFAKLLEVGTLREIHPIYRHDCNDCIFLGQSNQTNMDLYFCEQPALSQPTIIARWGDAPEANKSGLVFALMDADEELSEGLMLAKASGFL